MYLNVYMDETSTFLAMIYALSKGLKTFFSHIGVVLINRARELTRVFPLGLEGQANKRENEQEISLTD